MKCIVPQKNLVSALKIIKNSKALDKVEIDKETAIRVKFYEAENKIEFIASNVGVWVISTIDLSDFSKKKNPEEFFSIEDGGEIFVEGKNFISLMETFSNDCIIKFESNKIESSTKLEASIHKSDREGKKKKIGVLSVIEPKFFEETPPEENRKKVHVSAEVLIEAIKSVEFASDSDPARQYLWGVQIGIYDVDDITACATDTSRICYYDKKTKGRNENPVYVMPVKSSLVSAIKSFDPKHNVEINIGEKYTIMSQSNQIHGIPNVVKVGNESMIDWMTIRKAFEERCKIHIDVPRKPLLECLKTAMLTSGGRYGVRLFFDSKAKELKFSAENLDMDSNITSYLTETEPLSDDAFNSETQDSITFSAEYLREIISKYKSDKIKFRIQGTDQTVIISDDNEDFQYISTVIGKI